MDYSFIRLKPTIQEAIDTSPNAYATFEPICSFGQVQLSTTGSYTQITSIKGGISLNGNGGYAVHVIDACRNELLDITANTTITKAFDANGDSQMRFTISNIGTDFFYKKVLIRFWNLNTDETWASNIINITDEDLHLTSLFNYKNHENIFGIGYTNFNDYQTIRLKCAFMGNDIESKMSEYVTIDGLKVSSRIIPTYFEKFKITELDNFTYLRLNVMLMHPIVYVNDNRVTDKQTIKANDFRGETNLMELDLRLAINYNEKFSEITANPKDFHYPDFHNVDFLT